MAYRGRSRSRSRRRARHRQRVTSSSSSRSYSTRSYSSYSSRSSYSPEHSAKKDQKPVKSKKPANKPAKKPEKEPAKKAKTVSKVVEIKVKVVTTETTEQPEKKKQVVTTEKTEKKQVTTEKKKQGEKRKADAPPKPAKVLCSAPVKTQVAQKTGTPAKAQKTGTPAKAQKTGTPAKEQKATSKEGKSKGSADKSKGSADKAPKEDEPTKVQEENEPMKVKTPPDSPSAQLPGVNVKDLMQDSANLQLMILQAKQELADRRDTQQRQERREKEYFRPSFGDPVGPNNRLLLEEELGQGAFSTVFRARDLQANREDRTYAVKFIRKNPTLRTATEREVKLMRRLRLEASEKDPEGASCFLGLAGPEVFEHEGHLALCFQLQKCDLRCGLKRYGAGGGLPLPTVRSYARNIFMALRALKAVNVVHSDLKPDNLLMSLDKLSVKVSDFGCAMSSAELIRPEKAAETVQPRYYRAPEVILGQEYGTQVDIWGAGCTVFELATGQFLFTGRTNTDMLHDMMKHLGAFSRRFCGAGLLSSKHFRREDGAFCLGAEQFVGRENFPRPARPLSERLQEVNASEVALKAFAELIVSCVTPDPAVRTDPLGALASTFLRPNTKGGA